MSKLHFAEPEDDDVEPWRISDDDANDVAEVFSDENSTVKISRGQSIAYARMFAAAPDLLEALRLLHDNIAEYARINNLGGFDNQDMKLARAAIAKAEGAT